MSQRPSSEEPLLFTLYFSNQLGLNSSVYIQNKLVIFFKTILLEFYWIYRPIRVVVQSLSCVWLFVTPWTAACQASLSFTIFWSLLKLMSIPSNHLILHHPLLLLPSIFPSIRVFSNESALPIRWPKYWNFSISPSDEYSGLVLNQGQFCPLRDIW